jgi:uncharacterized protein YndB with AHSA1/START domain
MNTRTLKQTVTFKAPPEAVYEMLMDSKKHGSLSGTKGRISRKIGGPFTAWGGHLTGYNLALKPGQKIVQAWRATGWWPDHYSIAIFEIQRVKRGSRLRFTQIGIPPHRYSGHYRGWIETYWTPMKEQLEQGKLSDKTRARVRADTKRIRVGRFRRKLSQQV